MSRFLAIAALMVWSGTAVFITSVPAPAHAASITKSNFCSAWNAVCNRNCGRSRSCPGTCSSRYSQCLSSADGCYFFNVPAPRCYNNPADVKRVTDFRKSRRGR